MCLLTGADPLEADLRVVGVAGVVAAAVRCR
jgi:hypothetical protein